MDQKIDNYFSLDSKENYKELVDIISKDIDNKNIKILEFIECLGKYLTENKEFRRKKVIILLSGVIESISRKILDSQQIHVLTRFYCDCLCDQSCVKEILSGLYSLQKMDFFDDKEAVFMCGGLFKNFDSESNIQSIRYVVFQILSELVIKHQKALKKMGPEFIKGLIKIIGREKDPRNLILVFSIMNTVISEFDITSYAKDIFDLLFCYFPITFKPSINDVFGITSDDLKFWLNKCLSANDILSPYSIPLLINKYNFSSVSIKKDILDILSFCMKTYSPNVIKIYVLQIWNTLKNDLFEGTDDDFLKKSLDCLFIISKTLSKETSEISKKNSLLEFFSFISNEINDHFKEPDTKTAKNGIKILYALSSSSKYAFEILSKFCVSDLVSRFEKEDSINTKTAILELLSFILLSGLHVYGSYEKKIDEIPDDSILIQEKDRLLTISYNSLTTSSFSNKYIKAAAIRFLLTFSQIHDLLQYNELKLIVEYYNEIIIKEDSLKAEALDALVKIAEIKPNLIFEITFPNFLKLLSEESYSLTLNNLFQSQDEVILTTLSYLCVEKRLFTTLTTHLIKKFDDIIFVNDRKILYGRALMFTLLLAIRTNFTRKKLDIGSYINQLLPQLFTRVINACIDSKENIIIDSKIISIISQITNLIVRSSNFQKQKLFIADLINLFINGNSNLLFLSKNTEILKVFKPFDKNSTLYQKKTLPIFISAFAGIQKELLPLDLKLVFIKTATDLILENQLEDEQRIFLFRFISLIYNKYSDELNSDYCEIFLNEISKFSENDISKKKLMILYIFWVIKALILKTNKYGYVLLDKLINFLDDKHLGEFISYNFGIILDEDELINKENYASLQENLKSNYLVIFSYVIQYIPKQVIFPELVSIFPILLQCFSLDNCKLKASNINTLYTITLESPDLVVEHLASIIPFLLTFITKKDNSTNIQITALQCLGLFPTVLKTESIYPFKNKIIRKLTMVLDDPKKDVREEARKTKHKWHI
ncbi:hypothetical protein PNEG_00115 [Pneumocystis murina B123]|uniref:MMS19 nucleotide excision repair protein n=1 Tax=Pneumocystis murina (strain B123) TaxID=1069680 RepID=M7NSF0_PNEMU|nr:hypothetical protein PNEG_00115 [Pneumocystis murina B123]EMR11678.1 hypothetical protein PNEG_00115 [Pneumocystis murina B123]